MTSTGNRLWDKGTGSKTGSKTVIDERVHRFTVGSDPIVDLSIIAHDIVASAAHARMLHSIGILSSEELDSLLVVLRELKLKADAREIPIPTELEDCHTTIETLLVERLGDAGKRIHTGRSRNDQILVTMRLYLRTELLETMEQLVGFAHAVSARALATGHVPMPGYTHMQKAMPSSVKLWLHATVEATVELLREGLQLLGNVNCNPLGVGSGFGVSVALDRRLTAQLLGFDRVQRNPIEVQNSRGRFEKKALRFLSDISALVEKLSCDLMLYGTDEFGFFTLPKDLTTGSSIMPQKNNPDVLELLRSRTAIFRGALAELEYVTCKLPSNYHRDFQLTKEPTVRGFDAIPELLAVATRVVESFFVNVERLEAAMTPELYATYDVFRHTIAGVPFREAYRKTAEGLANGTFVVSDLAKDFEPIASACDVEFLEAQAELSAHAGQISALKRRWHECETAVLAETLN